MTKLTITKIGNSEGVILPKEILEKLHVSKGDALYVTESAGGGITLRPYDPAFEKQMEVAENIMRRYRNTLKKLAE